MEKENWEIEFDKWYGEDSVFFKTPEGHFGQAPSLKDFIRSQIALAYEQGKKDGYLEAVEAIPDRYGVHSNNLYDCDLTRLKSRLKAKLNK